MPSITLNNENMDTNYEYITDPEEIRRRVGDANISIYKHAALRAPIVLYSEGGHSYTCCNFDDFEGRGPRYSRTITRNRTLSEILREPHGAILLYNGR